jgi:AraC-like DNA-binding protein
MSQNGHLAFRLPKEMGAIMVGRFDIPFALRIPRHTHAEHQLVWSERGVVAVTIEDKIWILPSTLALWIPAGIPHVTEASSAASIVSPYFRRRRCPIRWQEPTVVAMTPLLREVVLFLSGADVPRTPCAHAQRLLLASLSPLPSEAILLTMPADPRARWVADTLLENPADRRELGALGKRAGASARTLARLFVAETGLTFGRWRTQLRVRAAVAHLATGATVTATAERVGYESVSAFVAAFRRQTGVSPGAYFTA